MKTIKLKEIKIESDLQKEVDRVAKKYKSFDEEFVGDKTIPDCVITQSNEFLYKQHTITDKNIIEALKEL